MMRLLSGTSSTVETMLEPVTGVVDLTVESKSGYNDSLKVYESDSENEVIKASVLINIPNEADKDTNTQDVNGIHNINDAYELLEYIDNLKLTFNDKDELFNEIVKDSSLNKEIVYNPYNLREKSNLSREQIYNLLEGSNLQVLSDSYYEIENKYNVNVLFLMALNMEESGHGTSDLALLNNNIGGVKSADGGWATFNDWSHSLEYIANLIDTMYLSEDGAYYNGTSIYDVNIRYCEGNQWAYNLNTIAMELLDKANSMKVNQIENL